MAEIKVSIKIDGFKCVEDMAQAVLNYTYKGKTLKEWADSISEPLTNADRIRAMSDEKLAVLLANTEANFPPNYPNGVSVKLCETSWLEWLKQEEGE